MKTTTLAIIFSTALISGLFGQQFDNPVSIPVFFDGSYFVDPGSPYLTISLNGVVQSGGEDDGGIDTYTGASAITHLKVNKVYNLNLSWDDIESYKVYLRTIEGYEFIIDGERRSLIENTYSLFGSGSETLSLVLVPSISGTATQPGIVTTQDFGYNKVIWSMSAGKLKNGQSAGTFMIRSDDFSSSLYNIGALEFYSNSSEVDYVHISSTRKQVMTRMALS